MHVSIVARVAKKHLRIHLRELVAVVLPKQLFTCLIEDHTCAERVLDPNRHIDVVIPDVDLQSMLLSVLHRLVDEAAVRVHLDLEPGAFFGAIELLKALLLIVVFLFLEN